MARVSFTKIPAGGEIRVKGPALTASLNTFTAFPSNKMLQHLRNQLGALTPANKQALNSNGENETEHM